jgi:hypothetical protein
MYGPPMTLILWAACDQFALVMADRRTYSAKVVATADGRGTELGDVKKVDDTTKAVTSDDGRDIYAIAGTSPAMNMVRPLVNSHGVDGDVALFAAIQPNHILDHAFDPTLFAPPNAVLHGYSHRGRIVCCRTQWSPTFTCREIIVAPPEKVVVAVAGLGGPLLPTVLQRDPARWAETESRVDDPGAVRLHLAGAFRDVAKLDVRIGPEADAWLLTKNDGAWRKLDE